MHNGRNRHAFAGALLLLCAISPHPARAQDTGNWRPVSTTARSITGPVSIANEKLVINFSRFPIAEIRSLTAAEADAIFSGAGTPGGSGHLYRLDIPAAQAFLRRNTLCGSESTEWMTTFVSGRTLQLAFFSGSHMPELTAEAVANSTSLCGTYAYTR